MTIRDTFIRPAVNAPLDANCQPTRSAVMRRRAPLAVRIRHSRLIGAFLAAGLLIGVCTSFASPSASAAKLPPANEIGINSKTIHIALLADVNTPVEPGLFQPTVNVMKAWAADVNAHGGLAGRKVVVDFCDSQLNPNTTTNCLIKACSSDFALVGTSALLITTFSNIDACKDEAGKAIGIPNFSGISFGPQEECDVDSYSVLGGDPEYCKTQNDNPQTYTVQTGAARYFLSKFKHLSGIWVYDSDTPTAKAAELPIYQAAANLGIKKVGNGFYPEAGTSPQSALTPLALAIKQYGATYASDGSTPSDLILLRREAQIQGDTGVKVWECQAGCYNTYFTEQGGAVVNGTYNELEYLPFYTECKINQALYRLAQQMGGTCAKIDSNSIGAFVDALLFEDVVNKIVAKHVTLTRQALFNELKQETAFTADGVVGTTDVAAHEPSPCFMMVEVIHGKWQRVYPTKPGTLNCSKKNLVTFKFNANAG